MELLFDVIKNDNEIQYIEWFLIGCILKNSGYLLKVFKDWTSLLDINNNDKVETIWDNINPARNVIYGLQKIAKKRNESKYKEWLVKRNHYLHIGILDKGENDIAKFVSDELILIKGPRGL